MKIIHHFKILSIVLGVCWASSTAQAVNTYSFVNISANNVNDANIGEAQLSVTVSDAGGDQVLFTFNNSGPAASSITDVYFDDGTLLAISTITSSAGVDFSQGASPGNLPSANSADPDFQTTAGFSSDSNPPTQPNGVNPGEWLGITFTLQGSQNYNDTIASLANGSLRIGIHVQGFDGGGSESFVNNGCIDCDIPGVPDAASTMMLLGMALMGVEAVRRRLK